MNVLVRLAPAVFFDDRHTWQYPVQHFPADVLFHKPMSDTPLQDHADALPEPLGLLRNGGPYRSQKPEQVLPGDLVHPLTTKGGEGIFLKRLEPDVRMWSCLPAWQVFFVVGFRRFLERRHGGLLLPKTTEDSKAPVFIGVLAERQLAFIQIVIQQMRP